MPNSLYRRLTTIGLMLSVIACRSNQERMLEGNWSAVSLEEDQHPVELDLTGVGLTFSPGNLYQYTGTLNYREAGQYRLEDHYLFTTDTLKSPAGEKAVEILLITPDTLQIRMMESGKERILSLLKQP